MKKQNSKEALSRFQSFYDFNNSICDAILLQFKKKLIGRYQIPPVQNIREFLGTAVYEICGEKEERDKYRWNINMGNCKCPNNISRKILEGIVDSTLEGYQDCWLRQYLLSDKFQSEFYHKKGNFFKFRQRTEAQKRINHFFTKQERNDFDKIGKILRREARNRMKQNAA